jgi:hypothetical protein
MHQWPLMMFWDTHFSLTRSNVERTDSRTSLTGLSSTSLQVAKLISSHLMQLSVQSECNGHWKSSGQLRMTQMRQASQTDLHLFSAFTHLVLSWSRSTKAQPSFATQSLRTIQIQRTLRIQLSLTSTKNLFHNK